MSNTTIGGYILNGNGEPFETLTPASVSSSELGLLKTLLDTEESHEAQESLKRNDVNSYIEHGKSLGIRDDKVLIYFSDCYNQSPKGISRIGDLINGQWCTLSLDIRSVRSCAKKCSSSAVSLILSDRQPFWR